jgi:Flp pilus assembly protein TadG
MRRIIQEERGSILIFSVIGMITALLFASMAIDVGCLLTAKNQLQTAVDASALAGATGFIVDNTEATSRAINTAGNNTCVNQAVQVGIGDIAFPAPNQIFVQANQNVNLFFAPVVGMNFSQVSAAAVAEMGTITGTPGLRPWALPSAGWSKGDYVLLKPGDLGAPSTVPSFYYCICFPPMNRGNPEKGACVYRSNIIHGTEWDVFIGDEIMVEPGNMSGPTRQGVNDLICQDPCAYWDGREIVNSSFPGTSSPRIVKLPLYDPNDPPDSGRKSIHTIGLASFFLLGMSGKDVMGIFVDKLSKGTFGNGNSMVWGVRLVQ